MILKRSPDEVNATYGDNIQNSNLVQKRFLHAEERRLAKIDELK